MSEVIPIFKTDNSFGKSVLTDKPPKKEVEGGARSVFSIAKENKLDTLFLIEDSMIGFYYSFKTAQDLGIKLVYGVYFKVVDENVEGYSSKVAILSKNDKGQKDLMKLYSECQTELGGGITIDQLKERLKDNTDVQICIPFYDSFIHWNLTNLDGVSVDLSDLNVVFFKEEKGLPFDEIISNKIDEYCKANKIPIQQVHSVFYEKEEDVKELQVLKILTNRSFSRFPPSLGAPNLEGFGSNQFSWESYIKKYGK